jgi:outer membrane biosynthesis protein TonB
LPHRFVVKSTLAICFVLSCSGAVMVLPRVAEAKPPAAKAAKQPIGVGAITGPQSAKVRAKLLKILRDSGSYEVTDVEDVKPGAAAATYQNMAKGISADAIVVGNVSRAMTLTLSVYGANGARVDAVQIKGGGSAPKLLKEMDNELEISLADPFERSRGEAQAAPAPAPAPAAPPPKAKDDDEEEEEPEPAPKAKPEPAPKAAAKHKSDELEAVDIPATPEEQSTAEPSSSSSSDSASTSDTGERGLRPYEISLGLRGYNRKFQYTGITRGELVPYELALAPTIFIAGDIYPGAFSGNGPLSHIGIMGRFEYGIATSSNYQAPGANGQSTITPLKTSVYEYQIGLRGRLPLGQHELGFFGVYGDQTFTLAGDSTPGKKPYAVVPDVHYHYLRFGLDARINVSKLVVGAHVAPRFLTSMSELDKRGVWFPGATGSGLDLGLMLGWQLKPWLMPAAGLDIVRYGFDFNNLPAAPPPRVIAGGATDTYASVWLGVLANLDFLSGGASASASAASDSSSSSESSGSADTADKSEDEAPPPPPPKKQPAAKKAPPKAAPPPPAPPAPAAKGKKAAPPPPAAKKKKAPQPEEEEEEEE